MRVVSGLWRRLQGAGSFAAMTRVVMMRSLALGVSVLTGLLTAAVLGPAGRGEQAALFIAPGFLAALSTLGLHASLIYNMKSDPEHERQYLGANMIMTFLSAAAVAGVGAILMPYWLHGFSPGLILLARLFLLSAPITAVSWSLTAACEVRGWFGFANGVAYVQNVGVLVSLLVVIRLGWLTPGVSAGIYVFSCVPVFLCYLVRVARAIRPIMTLRGPYPGRLLHYGLRFYGVDLMGSLSGFLDQIVVVPLLPPAAVGVYVVARSLAQTLGVLSDAVASVLFPSIAGKPVAVVIETVAKTIRATSLVNAALAIGLGVCAPFLLRLVYGSKFDAAVVPLQILVGASVLLNSARILYQAYTGSGRPGVTTMFEAAATAITFVALTCLIPPFGVAGAAIAILIASATRLGMALAGLPLILKVRIPRLFMAWSDLRSAPRQA